MHIDRHGKLTARNLDQGALRRHGPRLRGHAETHRVPGHPDDHRRARHEAGPHAFLLGLDACRPGSASCGATATARDLRWFKGPERCATHTMGCFSDGERVYIDMDMGAQEPVSVHSLTRTAVRTIRSAAQGRVTRLSVDLAQASRPGYEMEVLYPHTGVLSRQDDRYHTIPYSVGFMRCLDATQPLDPRLAGAPIPPVQHLDALRPRAAPHAVVLRRRAIRECRNAASCRARRARPKATAT